MSDFIILHFTDLHIKKSREEITKSLFNKIVEYIDKIKNDSPYFIILFSGDIIDQNEHCDLSRQLFKQLINDLTSILIYAKKIFFIFSGGNHDLSCKIDNSCTRCDEVKNFLSTFESQINNYIKNNFCENQNDCLCKSILNEITKIRIDNNRQETEIPHQLFEEIHKEKLETKYIESIVEKTDCNLFSSVKYNEDVTKRLFILKEKMYKNISLATEGIDRESVFRSSVPVNEFYKLNKTYQNYLSLVEELIEKYKDENRINIVTFNNTFIDGFQKLNLDKGKSVGVFNLNTSWLSTEGDHLNYKNMYVVTRDVIQKQFADSRGKKNDFNILVLHHPIEYISSECNETIEFIETNLHRNPKNSIITQVISENLINIAYCGHIHKNSDVLENAEYFPILKKYFINIPGSLIPPNQDIMENVEFNIQKSNLIPNINNGKRDVGDVGFYVTNVKYNSKTTVLINNNTVRLQPLST